MENYDPVKAEGHGKKAIFIIVAIVALGALAAGGYYLMQKNGDDVPVAVITPAPTAEPIDNSKLDSDSDGIPDAVELAIGTNPNRMNTDGDDYNDLPEIKNDYSPLAAGSGGKYTPEDLQILMDKIKAADPEFYEKEFGESSMPFQDPNTGPVGAVSSNPINILVYEADLNNIAPNKQSEAMEGVRAVIERRMLSFGITEPSVQIVGKNRLEVDLAGVKNVDLLIKNINEVPFLEFREEVLRDQFAIAYKQQTGQDLSQDAAGPFFLSAGLTGKDLAESEVYFDPTIGLPIVKLQFNDAGKKIFADLTTKNVGKRIAILLDGVTITAPTVNEPITDGSAVISGNFTKEEAETLVQRLNAGALPVPIKLVNK